MSYFAKVPTLKDGKGIVNEVIAADQEFIDSGAKGDASFWWQSVTPAASYRRSTPPAPSR